MLIKKLILGIILLFVLFCFSCDSGTSSNGGTGQNNNEGSKTVVGIWAITDEMGNNGFAVIKADHTWYLSEDKVNPIEETWIWPWDETRKELIVVYDYISGTHPTPTNHPVSYSLSSDGNKLTLTGEVGLGFINVRSPYICVRVE